jgi:hypothetical protein
MGALLLGAALVAAAQPAPGGSIVGKLTDLHSTPLAGATLTARNEATGAEATATTARNGAYRFDGLEAGEYTLEAASAQLGQGRMEGVSVIAGHEARVQIAMRFEPFSPVSIQIASHDIATETPVATATVASEPLQTLSLKGKYRQGVEREMPTTAASILTVWVPAEELNELTLSGWRRLNVTGEMPAVLASVLTVTLPAKNLRTLSMSGWPVPDDSRSSSHADPVLPLPSHENVRDAALKAPAIEVPASPIANRPGIGGDGSQMSTVVIQPVAEPSQPQPKRVQVTDQETDPVTPAVTATVSTGQLQELPLSGRRWQDFVLDAPEGGTPQSGGQQGAETTVDGASSQLAFGNSGSSFESGSGQISTGQAWGGGRGFAVSRGAIRTVETSASNAEVQAARAAGGHMNVATQRGTDNLHGQGFYFDRQNTWGARNPFTQWVKETSPATTITTPVFTAESYTPPDHETTWGIGLGSRIRRNRLFWFAALDSLHRNDPGLATVRHPDSFFAQPSNDKMQVLAARLDLSSSNPVAEGLAAYSKALESLAGLLGPAPRTATQWTGFGRIDWEASERNRFTLEGIGARWDSPGGGLSRVSATYGSNSFGSSRASEEWLLGRWEAFVTPNLLAVTQASVGREIMSARPETPSAYEKAFLSPNVWGQLPQIVVDSSHGFTIGNPSHFGSGSYPDEHLYQGKETLDWVHGGVLVKAGLDVRHNSDSTSFLRNQTGTYYYANAANFISDALSFATYGISGQLDPYHQHNCDQTGKVWRDSTGTLHGLGYLPCFSHYSQTIGPTDWRLSTNDWAGFATAQWQAGKLLVASAGLRWERELANADLPLTAKLPSLGNNWGPRVSLALGYAERHWPVLRLGYGIYFGRTQNMTLETALTHTGSSKGDLDFFMRPTDNLNSGGAPPFPYAFQGAPLNMVKPGAVEFAPSFRNPQIHQALIAVEEMLPSHVHLAASAAVSLGRHLPVSIDTNLDSLTSQQNITYAVVDGSGLGPIKTPQITVPFYASWPSATSSTGTQGRINTNYQQIVEIMSRANSTYEAATFRMSRYGRRGLSLHANYTYAHAMDWNPNETAQVTGSDVLDPADFSLEYGTSNLDIRHSAYATVIWEAPWKLHNLAGRLGNGWMLSGIGHYRSGRPYTMRTSGSLAGKYTGTSTRIEALATGMNGSGGDNRVYGVGRNTYRYPSTWKVDLRLGRRFNLGHMRQLELLAESFNLFNHQNVTQLETIGYYIERGSSAGELPTLNYLTGVKTNSTEFGQPLNVNATNFYRERQIQIGVKLRF